MIATKFWLHPLIPDLAVQLAGCANYRQDRDKSSGQSRWGGLCMYLHNDKGNTFSSSSHADTFLAEELNLFFSRFEAVRATADLPPPLPHLPSTHTLTLQEHQVRCSENSQPWEGFWT